VIELMTAKDGGLRRGLVEATVDLLKLYREQSAMTESTLLPVVTIEDSERVFNVRVNGVLIPGVIHYEVKGSSAGGRREFTQVVLTIMCSALNPPPEAP
jgi:hypothetical protein